jgi:hypothetical protein
LANAQRPGRLGVAEAGDVDRGDRLAIGLRKLRQRVEDGRCLE